MRAILWVSLACLRMSTEGLHGGASYVETSNRNRTDRPPGRLFITVVLFIRWMFGSCLHKVLVCRRGPRTLCCLLQAAGPAVHHRPRVRPASPPMSPQWGPVRSRLAPRTYDAPPCGPSVRVVSPTNPRKIPTQKHYRPFPCAGASWMGACSSWTSCTRSWTAWRTRREPFNFTPMGVNPISSGSPHVRPMRRTCGEPDEIKKNTHPKNFTALFREQG